jgi:hypothetical protein
MTISSTQLLTKVRTWLLVAGLTGLVIALGAVLGGAFLWLFAALAVIFNLVGYLYSDRIALRVARPSRSPSRRRPRSMRPCAGWRPGQASRCHGCS